MSSRDGYLKTIRDMLAKQQRPNRDGSYPCCPHDDDQPCPQAATGHALPCNASHCPEHSGAEAIAVFVAAEIDAARAEERDAIATLIERRVRRDVGMAPPTAEYTFDGGVRHGLRMAANLAREA